MNYKPIYMNPDFQNSVLRPLMQDLDAPLFFYDLDFLKKHLEEGVSVCQKYGIRYLYACKANSLGSIIACLRDAGTDFDVASAGELNQVLKAGVDASQIICTGPAKSRVYLAMLLARGVRSFILESEQQLCDLQALCETQDLQVEALLRLQLDWDRHDNSVLGGSSTTVFGLEDQHWIQTLKQNNYSRIQIRGVHCFQWGNLIDLNDLAQIWKSVMKRSLKFCKDAHLQPEVIDLGGGLGIDYANSNISEYSWPDIGGILGELKAAGLFNEIWIEPGRYSVGLCGAYLNRVVDRKINRDQNFLILEGGMNHLLRPALTGEGFPVTNMNQPSTEQISYSLHGPLCTALDWLGSTELSAASKAGDVLMFSKTGAYGFSESMPLFLAHQWPAEVSWSNEEIKIERLSTPAEEFMK